MAWLSGLLPYFMGRSRPLRQRKPRHTTRLQVSELEPRLLLTAYHLDFGSEESPVGSGHVSAPVAGYSASIGYGWTNPAGVREVVRGSGTSLTRDFHAEKDRTFQLDLPNGTYLVTPTLGDATMVRDQMDINFNGKTVASNLSVPAGRPHQPTYRIEVTNGKLTMRLVDHGGETVRWAISALDVVSTTSAAPVVAINPDQIVQEGADVSLKGTVSSKVAVVYAWNFGDGKTSSGSLAAKHKYADDGTYEVTLTATDALGRIGRASATVIVKNGVPRTYVTGKPSTKVTEGAAVTLTSNPTDPGAADVAAGFNASWAVTKNGGAYASTTGKTSKFTFTPDDEGTYVIKLKVTDKDGATSATISITIVAVDTPLRANALGPYTGSVGKPIYFAGVARDNGALDAKAGYSYAWNFGDGATATGATPNHKYAATGTYNVTLTVTGKNGAKITTKTTAKISASPATNTPADYQILTANLLANAVYGNVQWKEMAASGAWGVNAKWEQGTSSKWYIEQQRCGETLIIDGLLHNDPAAIAAGFKVFDWGFKHQASDGSFKGTQDPFHSTSFFVEAVSRACLLIKQSPYASQYQSKVDAYKAQVYKAAKWMATPEVWSRGISNNQPYTHRHYLVAAAMGLTSQLVGGDAKLMSLARSQILAAVARQKTDGVNPEAGGYDSSYQAVGIAYAQLWATYFSKDSATAAVKVMITKGLAWEHLRVLSSGQVDMAGNTRTGVETGPSSTIKTMDWRNVVISLARCFQTTGDSRWHVDAQKVAQHYYKSY